MFFEVQFILEDLNKVVDYLCNKLGNFYSLVIFFEWGIYFNNWGEGQIIFIYFRLIIDVCGVGDMVFVVVGFGFFLGMLLEEIVCLFNLVGGQVCEWVGVVFVNWE